MMIMRSFSDFLYKGIYWGYSFELHRQVDAIQMSTHNICLYKELDKKYTGCNRKITELLECALIGVCAVIRLNSVDCPDVEADMNQIKPPFSFYLTMAQLILKLRAWWEKRKIENEESMNLNVTLI